LEIRLKGNSLLSREEEKKDHTSIIGKMRLKGKDAR